MEYYNQVKKYIPAVVGILFAAFAYKYDVDMNVIGGALLSMAIIYALSRQDGVSSNKMEADIKKMQTENEGLKTNLMKVYQIVQQGQSRSPPQAPPPLPPRDFPPKAQSQDTPNAPIVSAAEGTERKPYV